MTLPKPTSKAKKSALSQDNAAPAMLKKWLSISESQICALEVLCAQLPEVKDLLETNMTGVSEKFIEMAAEFEKYDAIVRDALTKKTADNTSLASLDGMAESIANTLSQVIVDMQFQDRVSQNLVITINVLNATSQYLQDEIDMTISNLNRTKERADLDADFARNLIALLTLGELQHKFVNHLLTHGYISTPGEIGYDPGTAEQQQSGDVDLF